MTTGVAPCLASPPAHSSIIEVLWLRREPLWRFVQQEIQRLVIVTTFQVGGPVTHFRTASPALSRRCCDGSFSVWVFALLVH